MYQRRAMIESMSHLSAERLAALASEQPTSAELAHLAGCRFCAAERGSHAAVRRLAAAEIARDSAPITEWGAIAARLRADGMISDVEQPGIRFVATRWALRAAAALLLVTGGVVLGRVSSGDTPVPGLAFGGAEVVEEIDPIDPIDLKLVSGGTDSITFGSPDEALAVLQRAEHDYARAAAFLMGSDPTTREGGSAAMIRARHAALDAVASATRVALYEAPHEQVINRYSLSAHAAREATLRQLGTALPAGYELNSY